MKFYKLYSLIAGVFMVAGQALADFIDYDTLHGGYVKKDGSSFTYILKYDDFHLSWLDEPVRGSLFDAPGTRYERITTSLADSHSRSGYAIDQIYRWNRIYSSRSGEFYQGICIGGDRCGQKNAIVIPIPPNGSGYVSRVYVNAHDRIGRKHRAHLQLWEGNELIAEQDVKKDGSLHTFILNRPITDTLYLRSVHESWRQGGKYLRAGDETMIEGVFVYDN